MTNQPSISELFDLLNESQVLLDAATVIERKKRSAVLESELESALAACASASEEGYAMARRHIEGSGAIIRQARDRLAQLVAASASIEDSQPDLGDLRRVIAGLAEDHDRVSQQVEDNRQRLNTFNITLFGRTMSGKSTLMEILTKGDGKSIGNGAQRATRDVRSYQWNGLTVTDVPGIAAFEGIEDEETALAAAEQADLVLFLITDDAPQPAEADHLARLRNRGLPLLGICNVKENLGTDLHIRRFIRDRHKSYDPMRLGDLSRQFDELADLHTPGVELELVYAHLHAKFLADRPEPSAMRGQLEVASQFWEVEERILNEVVTNGEFLRQRSFLDSAAIANLDAVERMLEGAHLMDLYQKRFADRIQELHLWRMGFMRRANRRIDQLIQETVGSLRSQIPDFANSNYQNENIERAWNSKVRLAGIERKMKETQRDLANECQRHLDTLIKEMQREFELLEIDIGRVSLEAGKIRDYQRLWNWIRIGAPLVGLIPGVGIVAGIVAAGISSLLGRLFRGRAERRRREAVARISSELRRHMNEIERQIRDGMRQWLGEFTEQYLGQVANRFDTLKRVAAQSADSMRRTARGQRDALSELNRETIVLALRHTGHDGEISKLTRVARIPGQAQALLTYEFHPLSEAAVADLETLFNESVIQLSNRLDAPANHRIAYRRPPPERAGRPSRY